MQTKRTRPGSSIFVFTPTFYYTGTVVEATPFGVTLDDCVIVYDTGPIEEFMAGKPRTSARLGDGIDISTVGAVVGSYPVG